MDIADLQRAVFSRQTTLAKIYETSMSLDLAGYARQWRVSEGPSGADRDTFFAHMWQCAASLYGDAVAQGVQQQLESLPLVSTIDHHGIFGHPFFLNSNLIHSLRQAGRYLICLPTAGVSLNNNTSWSGCVLLAGPGGSLRRFSFFPDKVKTHPVLATDAFLPEGAAKVISQLKAADGLSARQKERLVAACERIFTNSRFAEFPDFSSQAAVVSRLVWKEVFPTAPELVYIPLEKLVSDIVAGPVASDERHILHRLFFTTDGWNRIEKHFHGSLGAFTSKHKGSFLFWGIDSHNRRVHLVRAGEKLIDHSMAVPANPTAIVELMQNGELYPTSLMCFIVLLYYGMTALGGFNQVNWLTDIKRRFVVLLQEWGENSLAERVAEVPSDNFAESNLAFGLNSAGEIYKPTAWDLLAGGEDLYERYHELAQRLTVGDSLLTQLPEIYRVVTPPAERDEKLLAISERHIVDAIGLSAKIAQALKTPNFPH